MWENELDRAKQYIKNGDYYRARTLLEKMQGNKTAREWLKKLDKLENRYEFPDSTPSSSNTHNYGSYNTAPQNYSPNQQVVINQNFIQNNVRGVPSCAMTIVLLNMIFWSCAIVSTAMMVSPEAGATAIVGVVFWFVITLAVYMFLWKFFWWTLAVGWTFATFFFIVMLASGTNLLMQLPR